MGNKSSVIVPTISSNNKRFVLAIIDVQNDFLSVLFKDLGAVLLLVSLDIKPTYQRSPPVLWVALSPNNSFHLSLTSSRSLLADGSLIAPVLNPEQVK